MLGLLRARRKLDLDDYAASALWGAYECARSGVTCIADTTYEGWIVGRAAAAAGLRARVYVEAFGLDDSQLPAAMERLEERVDKLREECGQAGAASSGAAPSRRNLVDAGVSPHAPYTVSARLYREVARFARHEKLFLATHLAESQAEVDLLTGKKNPIMRAYQAANLWTGQNWSPPGLRPVQYLAGTGALSPQALAIHVVQADADDIAALAATGAGVAHCPRSNLRLHCGRAPVAEMRAAGIMVGLGTDSLASNDDLDLFAEMRAALAVSRARAAAGAPLAALTPGDVLRMATLEGARALGLDALVGTIEPGKRADLVAIRLPHSPADAREAAPDLADPPGGQRDRRRCAHDHGRRTRGLRRRRTTGHAGRSARGLRSRPQEAWFCWLVAAHWYNLSPICCGAPGSRESGTGTANNVRRLLCCLIVERFVNGPSG